MERIIFKDESYKIIGVCMEVHKNMGMGFREILYKDALEIEFRENNIPYEREVNFKVKYKGQILPHEFYADFILYNSIVLEIKAASSIAETFLSQTLNYLKVSSLPLGIIVNFGQPSLNFKRIVL